MSNMAEVIAAEVIARFFPHRFEEEDPVTWIEQYHRTPQELRKGIPEFSKTVFENYNARIVWHGQHRRIQIGQPRWQFISRGEVEKLVGRLED